MLYFHNTSDEIQKIATYVYMQQKDFSFWKVLPPEPLTRCSTADPQHISPMLAISPNIRCLQLGVKSLALAQQTHPTTPHCKLTVTEMLNLCRMQFI